ncbi:murein hydrolase activator EnvC family protein [Selenomonas sputigena]|uniref:Peptidase M23 n=1 Tax=Selenomonas sputigena (strain ATCC 35185 / DSM 20758 / CCUG 44933 / VPI D19B-28) TaxID=546271 RepID=C9LUC2_SELS3|nr:peptidoglycan DD-metalloendopeptidase family protein [Selenomonas sputigena]AEC00254.1 Peptidase M23 [Selenomonas sputigena ATCC 35185]EEX77653.1 peptidase, M23 family [Selenomonas sputigena ATCC 35185]
MVFYPAGGKKGKKAAAAFLSAVYLMTLAPLAQAETLEEQRDAHIEKAEQAQKKKNEIESRIEGLSEEKRAVDEAADEATKAYKDVKKELDATEARIDENEDKLKVLNKDFVVKRDQLAKRVRDIYINGQINYLDVLFGAKDFQDFFTRMDLLKRVIQQDYDLVQVVFAEKTAIETSQKELEKDKTAKEKLVASAADRKKEAEKKQAAKQAIIDKMETDRATQERIINENLAASKEVEQMIRNSRYQPASPALSGGGALNWPLGGPITSPFGWRVHPITGASRFHSGIDIGGDYGDTIHAAGAGIVSYAGWISGYGYAVIIDHGGGISTLYGHNQALLVSEGQSVSQGQAIAECGSTGNSTGPHCHFEVRVDGEPVDPMGYL